MMKRYSGEELHHYLKAYSMSHGEKEIACRLVNTLPVPVTPRLVVIIARAGCADISYAANFSRDFWSSQTMVGKVAIAELEELLAVCGLRFYSECELVSPIMPGPGNHSMRVL